MECLNSEVKADKIGRDTTSVVPVITDSGGESLKELETAWLDIFHINYLDDSNHYFCRTNLQRCNWYENKNSLFTLLAEAVNPPNYKGSSLQKA